MMMKGVLDALGGEQIGSLGAGLSGLVSLGCSFKHYQASYLIHTEKNWFGLRLRMWRFKWKSEKVRENVAVHGPGISAFRLPSAIGLLYDFFRNMLLSLKMGGKNMNETEMNCNMWDV